MMELGLPLVLWSSICLAVALLLLTRSKKKATVDSKQLPPGPPGWPVIGNILDLGALPHHGLTDLGRKYGPIILLRLGAVNTLVVSSAGAAMVMYKNHDLAFSGRVLNEAVRVHSYYKASVTFSNYGPYWRMIRRICATELFANNQISASENIRRKCVDKMIRWMWDESQEKGSVEVARFVTLMNFNVIGNLMLSKDLGDPQSKEGAEFFTSLHRTTKLGAKPNIADFFPFLRWLDPQRIKKTMKRDLRHTLNFASGFVKERILDRQNNQHKVKKDFLDVMLDFQGNQKDGEPAKISEINVATTVLELINASTDTTTSIIEWAITELLLNPNIMRNAQTELDQVVGQNKKVEESHIGDLHYLQLVVKETLRLHPAIPLLVPHRAIEDTKFMGYFVPKDTQILVNIYAIARDPVWWDDPISFKPERFMNSDTDYKGHHFQFLPFGSGRRICPGMSLADPILHLSLATMIHTFEWALEDGILPENMDMGERLGITLGKADPLKAVLKLRVGQEIPDPVA